MTPLLTLKETAAWLKARWGRWHQPHDWSDLITIPPQSYFSDGIRFYQQGRRFRICKRCGVTDATARYWRYCRPWRVMFLDKEPV